MDGKKKFEFSKWIAVVVGILNVFVIAFTCFMIYRTNDLTPFTYLIPSLEAASAICLNAYFSKAAKENQIKLMKAYGVEPSESAFSEHF